MENLGNLKTTKKNCSIKRESEVKYMNVIGIFAQHLFTHSTEIIYYFVIFEII